MGSDSCVSLHFSAEDRRMPLLRPVTPAERRHPAPERVAAIATGQDGVVSRAQLLANGISDSAISRWVASGRLHRIHPRVYTVGHPALSLNGRLWAAMLFAGPGAAFSHTTAAWLWQILEVEPARIHLTVPGRRRSIP